MVEKRYIGDVVVKGEDGEVCMVFEVLCTHTNTTQKIVDLRGGGVCFVEVSASDASDACSKEGVLCFSTDGCNESTHHFSGGTPCPCLQNLHVERQLESDAEAQRRRAANAAWWERRTREEALRHQRGVHGFKQQFPSCLIHRKNAQEAQTKCQAEEDKKTEEKAKETQARVAAEEARVAAELAAAAAAAAAEVKATRERKRAAEEKERLARSERRRAMDTEAEKGRQEREQKKTEERARAVEKLDAARAALAALPTLWHDSTYSAQTMKEIEEACRDVKRLERDMDDFRPTPNNALNASDNSFFHSYG
jgi:hypothetical protein